MITFAAKGGGSKEAKNFGGWRSKSEAWRARVCGWTLEGDSTLEEREGIGQKSGLAGERVYFICFLCGMIPRPCFMELTSICEHKGAWELQTRGSSGWLET